MAFADPQSVTYNAVAKSLPKTPNGPVGGTQFLQDTQEFELLVSHSYGPKRTRRVARLNRRVVAADPLTAVNAYQSMSAYLVVDIPLTGFTIAEQHYLISALTAWLAASSDAAVLKLLGGE
ncbi:coat protein [ssRNA phage Esthiorhiza.3_9]|uniref:Coat protein n=2 Tax=Leviviricetes TaxID=2842243 RepID=A0A8S5L2Q2_9VIRU|nr:coat protein [ssRNA phage Esthiorhiza.3_9]QDH87010.1 MAG: hypothetical protein H3RhizoLitter14741_000002 [Leviviridae sp.]DAD51426.1 TPA_asm: coat protein [ssRNA phage Esthiorhiza.3_9]